MVPYVLAFACPVPTWSASHSLWLDAIGLVVITVLFLLVLRMQRIRMEEECERRVHAALAREHLLETAAGIRPIRYDNDGAFDQTLDFPDVFDMGER